MVVRRMAHEPRLLGQHDDVIVFVADVKRNRLAGQRRVDGFLRDLVHDGLAGFDRLLLRSGIAGDEHLSLLDGACCGRPALIQAAFTQKGIEASTLVGSRGDIATRGAHDASLFFSFLNAKMRPMNNSTKPQVTPMSATLNTGKSMKLNSMKSTT